MYLIPGMECVEEALEVGRKRWGMQIRQYPHWVLSKLLNSGVYRLTHDLDTRLFDKQFPDLKLKDIYALARADSGIQLLMTGAKKADSIWRRKMLGNWGSQEDVLYPLIEWSKVDVLAFMKANDLPEPSSSEKNATGIDLTPASLLWLHDQHPRDFARLCEVFPLAEAIVWHRKFYGGEEASAA